ncbi:NAD-dependent epimerase/dehydratase family protein [Dactylosporangium sucinum]|uniref:dTDP-glucose 4,6-dehydratase n=1 Tax=Dactylosporangium sucinum TaxID=1424081 RepID=A0A917X5M9_9ACTN|nr:NAD(P)-dependent oxidoreductase [Dactylosporangium sucinum]GGM82054.1 dTDP-glucose 4,6-dehydratase [Dactylosporangium sucinum]
MRILVAGATGAIGRQLVPQLLDAGHDVTGFSRTAGGIERIRGQGATAVQGDVFDRDGLRALVVAAAPDVVIHQLTDLAGADDAANSRLWREGTRNLVDAARQAGVGRFVVQSLAFAYVPGEEPADETVPLDTGATAEPVRAMEEIVAEVDTAVALRYGTLYGPGTWYAPGGAVAAALKGEPGAKFLGSIVADRSVTSFVHVADAAGAAVDALGWPSGPVNIVDDEPAQGRAWLPVLAAAIGAPAPEESDGRMPGARGASNRLARSRGWRPRYPSWRTSLGR